MAADPENALRRQILPALGVCGVCSKPESDHGTASHKFERKKVLPEWRGRQAFRCVLATNLNRLGVGRFVIQPILRHNNRSGYASLLYQSRLFLIPFMALSFAYDAF